MQAHSIKYGTKVIVTDENVKQPPGAIHVSKGNIITIYKLDGMYCSGSDKDSNRIYIAGWTEVEPCI